MKHSTAQPDITGDHIGPHQIGPIGESRAFSLADARALFPVVQRITREAHAELEPVRRELIAMLPANPRIREVEGRYQEIVKRWVAKMERLGLVVKGLWLVDFDTGDGYLCWKFPELQIGHFHGYQDGFAARRPLREVIEESNPDWASM
jgi:hypothetical protein